MWTRLRQVCQATNSQLFRRYFPAGLGAQPGGGMSLKSTLSIFDDSSPSAQRIWSDHTYRTTLVSLLSAGTEGQWEDAPRVVGATPKSASSATDPFGIGVPVCRYRSRVKDYPRLLADSALPDCMINMQAFHLGLPMRMGEWGYRECEINGTQGIPVANRTLIENGHGSNEMRSSPGAAPTWPRFTTALWQGDIEPTAGQLYRYQEHFTLYAQLPEHAQHGIHPGLRSFYWPYYTLHVRHIYPNSTEVQIFHDRVKQVKFQLAVTVLLCASCVLFLWVWAALLRRRQLLFEGTRHSITPEEVYEERSHLHSQEVFRQQWEDSALAEKQFKAKSRRVKAYNIKKRRQLAADERKMHEEAMMQMEQLGNSLFTEDSFMQDIIARASDKQVEDQSKTAAKKTQLPSRTIKDHLGPRSLQPSGQVS